MLASFISRRGSPFRGGDTTPSSTCLIRHLTKVLQLPVLMIILLGFIGGNAETLQEQHILSLKKNPAHNEINHVRENKNTTLSSSLPILQNTNTELAIVYKTTDAYDLIWKDAGSGADMDGAIWSAKNYNNNYCSLGDTATGNHGLPTHLAYLVSKRKHAALINPTSFTRIWNDSGSGAHDDVTVYRMNAPTGYTCIGHVAVRSHSSKPKANKYCCVHNQYLVQGDAMHTWNDKGSGARSDVSFWTLTRSASDPYGIDAGNFIGTIGYNKPTSSAFKLLKADEIRVKDIWTLSTDTNAKPLTLYEVPELKKIWDDSGSGANTDCSIWRVESRSGYFPVGDIVVATHSKPKIGFLMKDNNDSKAFRPPQRYSRIWNDSGSGAHHDVSLWKIHCSPGYVALGNVATGGSEPKIGDIYCIKVEYATYGHNNNWKYIWRDHGSGAHKDVSIFEAKSTSSNQQTVRGFGAIALHYNYPTPLYMLKKNSLVYRSEKPVKHILMSNVIYKFGQEAKQGAPENMAHSNVLNKSDLAQTMKRVLEYSWTELTSFSFSNAIEIGIAVEFNAGVPLIGGAKTTVSAATTFTFTSGSERSESKTDSREGAMTVPPHSRGTMFMTGSRYKVDIPYTADLKKTFYDGTVGHAKVSGIYKGVTVSSFDVAYGKTEYLEKPCIDDNIHCPYWYNQGYCKGYYATWMSSNCKKSCNTCN